MPITELSAAELLAAATAARTLKAEASSLSKGNNPDAVLSTTLYELAAIYQLSLRDEKNHPLFSTPHAVLEACSLGTLLEFFTLYERRYLTPTQGLITETECGTNENFEQALAQEGLSCS